MNVTRPPEHDRLDFLTMLWIAGLFVLALLAALIAMGVVQ